MKRSKSKQIKDNPQNEPLVNFRVTQSMKRGTARAFKDLANKNGAGRSLVTAYLTLTQQKELDRRISLVHVVNSVEYKTDESVRTNLLTLCCHRMNLEIFKAFFADEIFSTAFKAIAP